MSMLTFAINLARRPDRRAAISKQLVDCRLEPRYIDAIDGQLPSFKASVAQVASRTGMGFNEIACYQSHQKAWQAVLDSGAPCALILEDDAILSGNVAVALAGLADMADQFDVVRLSALRRLAGIDVCALPPVGRLILAQKNPSGLVGYVVSQQGARRLSTALHEIHMPVDTAMDRYWQWGGMVLTLAPSVVLHDKASQSDIAPGGRVCVSAPRAGWPRLRFYARRRWAVYKTYWRCGLRSASWL